MPKMKILFITRKFPPSIGGMQKVSFQLYRELNKNHEVYLVAWGKSQKWLPLFLLFAFFRSAYLIKVNKPDVVYLNDGLLAPFGLLLKLLFKIKIVITVHGLDITYPNPLYQRVVPFSLARLDKIVCVSNATLEECIKRSLSRNICVLIPNGADPKEYRINLSKEEIKKRLTKTFNLNFNGKFILLSIGRLVKRKGHVWFIKQVLPKLPKDIVYLIVGSGSQTNEVKALIEKKSLHESVYLLGQISEEEKKLLLNGSDLMVMPNIKVRGDFEGFGIVALEAASCSLPVVASEIEGIKDTVQDGKNGFLIPPYNAATYVERVSQLLQDRKKRERLARNGYDFIRSNYTWDIIADKYSKAFLDKGKFSQ